MPVCDDVQLISSLPCDVQLPAEWTDFFEKCGSMRTHFEECRRYPRFYFRTPAALQYLGTYASLQRPPDSTQVFVKDVSRSGLGFLSGCQIFPNERLKLLLCDGNEFTVAVSRCQRIDARCYDVGANFV